MVCGTLLECGIIGMNISSIRSHLCLLADVMKNTEEQVTLLKFHFEKSAFIMITTTVITHIIHSFFIFKTIQLNLN